MSIDLDTFAKRLNLKPHVRYVRHLEDIRILYSFDKVEIKPHLSSSLLTSAYGTGANILEAKQNYAREIAGKILVHRAFSSDRREYETPNTIDVLEQPDDARLNAAAYAKTGLNQFLKSNDLKVEVQMQDPSDGIPVMLKISSHYLKRSTGSLAIVGQGNTLEEARNSLCKLLQNELLTPYKESENYITAPMTLVSHVEPSVEMAMP